VAVARRSVSWIGFPLSNDQAKTAKVLVLKLFSPKPQGLRLQFNGAKLPTQKLKQGWQLVQVTLGGAQAGENHLELTWGITGRIGKYKASAALELLFVGKAVPKTLLAPATDGKLALPPAGGLAFYLYPYKQTRLRLHLKSAAPCMLSLEQRAAGKGPPTQTLQVPAGTHETYFELQGGGVIRAELTASGKSCQGIVLDQAALVRPGKAPLLKRGAAPKNVLFWMIDNVRADRYRAYNNKTRVTTPVIDALCKDGTVFEHAYIQGTESRVSHATIWTGLYPKQHNFIAPKAKLNLAWVTLPEAIQQTGRHTAAWIANGFVSKFWGFGQGWSTFRNTLHKGGGLTGKRLAEHAVKFIEEKGDKPFYIYVGTIDPHVSWRGRQPWLNQYHPEPYSGQYKKNVYGKDLEKIILGKRKLNEADKKRILAIYDSTVSYNDHHLGRVLKALSDKGIRDQTMIVITADHGEEFWDYGRMGHGHSLKHPLVAVPLIVHYPPLFGRGVKVREGVDVVSVMPTILDAIEGKIPPTVQGESLLPLSQGIGRGYPRPSIATQYEFAHTMRMERWKIRVGGKDVRLHDLSSKEKEAKNVAGANPLALRWLSDAMGTFKIYQRGWRSMRHGVPSNQKAALSADIVAGALKKIRP